MYVWMDVLLQNINGLHIIMLVPATNTVRFLDWSLGFKELSVIRLTQCINTTLNIVSHITHLLAAYN